MKLVVHCKREPFDVYIGRGLISMWGNPFVIGRDGTREEVLRKFEHFLYATNHPDARRMRRLAQTLKGQRLGCWCSPLPCHGSVLIRFAWGLPRKYAPESRVE